MAKIKELETDFRKSNDLQLQLVRDIGMFSVALFAVSNSKQGDLLELAGTGTLIERAGSHYILTAAHVWENGLKWAAKVGITLAEQRDHKFLMDTKTIVPFGPPKPTDWNEWGPDIIFLRIPSELAGTINAYKVFYDPTIHGKKSVETDHLECQVLIGTLHALGTFTQIHAEIQIKGFFVQIDAPRHSRDGFDYIDFEVEAESSGLPTRLGGVSGGGSWKVLLYRSVAGKIEWVHSLEGVAFWESPLNDHSVLIRCHGPGTLHAAMPR